MLNLERRRRRGETLDEALKFQLAACAEDEGLAAMVLADDEGLCVAAWGDSGICEEVASRAPLAPGDDSTDAHKLWFGQIELYLCAVGGESQARKRSLERSASGVSRILGRWMVA